MKVLKQMVMKKILTILAFFFLSYGYSQTGINYQAIIKNSSGNVYSNATMIVTFSLRYDTSGGSVIYSETHNATSISEGHISLVVGTGNKTSNGVNFSAIDFSRSIFYTTEVNIGGAGNILLGTQQLRSVSSAYFAKTAASISPDANDNVVIGSTSSMVSMTSGIAIGSNAVTNNTTGIALTAVGISALRGNTTGNNNTAIGNFALSANTTGDNNTAIGYQTGTGNTTGVLNTAIGSRAMRVNVTGSSNTALGNEALTLNTTGSENTALGVSALTANSTGTQNVAVGKDALYNSDGNRNTAVGYKSFGGKASFFGTVGEDDFGDSFKKDLEKLEINFLSSQVESLDGKTSKSLILVSKDGERTMCTYLGASTFLSIKHFDPSLFTVDNIIYLEGYLFDSSETKASMIELCKIAKNKGLTICLSLSDSFCVERHRDDFLVLIKKSTKMTIIIINIESERNTSNQVIISFK